MDELDEIAQLEAAGQKLMTEPATPPRKRDAAKEKQASTTGHRPMVTEGDSAHVENLLTDIRDRLDRLLQANAHLPGSLPENPQPPIASGLSLPATVADESDESDELRKAFPHEDDAEKKPPAKPVGNQHEGTEKEPPPSPAVNIMISDSDMTRLLTTVEDWVTRHALTHHSSVVVLLGWAMALLAAGLGMGYGAIVASDRYPFWEPAAHAGFLPRIAAAYLGAPVGVVLLPIAGAILWEASKEASDEKYQTIWRLAAIGVFLAGILLPVTAVS